MARIAPQVVPTVIAPVPVDETTPVAVAAVPVVSSNVKFRIEGTRVIFERTAEPFNNRDVFETFDLARSAAIQAFGKHKNDVMTAINATEKKLLVISEEETLGTV